jgi:putative inorganic carbon (hco3(-)) transporter
MTKIIDIPVAASRATFLLLVLSLAFMRPNFIILGSVATVTDLIFVACAIFLAIAVIIRRRPVLVDRSYLFFGLYALALLLSAIFSSDPSRSFRRLPAELYLPALAIVALNVVTDERMLRRTAIAWVAGASVAALLSALTVAIFYTPLFELPAFHDIAAYALHYYGTLPAGNYPRIQGTFEYPSMFCNFMTVGLMLLVLWPATRSVARGGMRAVLLLLFGIAMFFTLTPGLGGVLAALGIWAYVRWIDRRPKAATAALAGSFASAAATLLAASFTPFVSTNTEAYFTISNWSFGPSGRLLAWSDALSVFLRHPFFGSGIGIPPIAVYFPVPSGEIALATDAHNAALNVAAQTGIVGLAALVALTIEVLRRIKLGGAVSDQTSTIRTALGIAFISCFLIQGLVGSFENARHLWVLIGLIFAADRIMKKQPPTEVPRA